VCIVGFFISEGVNKPGRAVSLRPCGVLPPTKAMQLEVMSSVFISIYAAAFKINEQENFMIMNGNWCLSQMIFNR
jgi:hypothetical protein